MQYGSFRLIAKAHMLQHNMPLHFFRRDKTLLVRFLCLVEHLKHTLRTGKRRNRIHLHGNFIDGSVKTAGILDRNCQSSKVKAAQYHQKPADTCRQSVAHIAELMSNRPHNTRPKLRIHLRLTQFFIEIRKFIRGNLLMSKNLHHFLSCYGLLCKAV